MAVDTEERNRRKVGQLQGRLATCFVSLGGGLRQGAAGSHKQQGGKHRESIRKASFRKASFCEPVSDGRKIGVPSAHHNPPKYSGVTTCDSPTTLPPPGITIKEECRFGRVGKPVRRHIASGTDYTLRHKALVYSISPEVGSMTAVTCRGRHGDEDDHNGGGHRRSSRPPESGVFRIMNVCHASLPRLHCRGHAPPSIPAHIWRPA